MTTKENPSMDPELRHILDEASAGPWKPEGRIDYDEDANVIWLTNAAQDSLRLDASDVALLLNATLAEGAPR